MLVARFYLPMTKYSEFIKTKDCLTTGIVDCLTLFPPITRLSNQESRIFMIQLD